MCFTKYLRNKNGSRPKSRRKPKPVVATEDITVWKAFSHRVRKRNGVYAGYAGRYYNMEIKGNKEYWKQGYIYYETTPFITSRVYRSIGDVYLSVEGHAFHSFVHKSSAELLGSLVFKMIIPKGSLYYTDGKEYVSNQIYFPRQKTKK